MLWPPSAPLQLMHIMTMSHGAFIVTLSCLFTLVFLPDLISRTTPDSTILRWIVWSRDALTQAGAAFSFCVAIGMAVAIVKDGLVVVLHIRDMWQPPMYFAAHSGVPPLVEDEAPNTTSESPPRHRWSAFERGLSATDVVNKLMILFVASALVWYELLRLKLVSPEAPLRIHGFTAFLVRGTLYGVVLGVALVLSSYSIAWLWWKSREVDNDDGEAPVEVEVLEIERDGKIRAPLKLETV
ncbi:hypothetical protein MIND_01408100 [Mycena indigotica]|uniref:Uncharacterized protein n=1 Tax=Mycena indigotica TaxID=2126181 RepID=A0A8H6RX48_9AGAR|nr:uncharacterized protein MIND_01408100 [Mycena indigotica]KAF7288919.1 hypothetical protein MIND_01408100 [Mycena indigotica]